MNGLCIQWLIETSVSEKVYTFPFSISKSTVLCTRDGYNGSLGTFTIATKKGLSSLNDQQVKVYGNGNTVLTHLYAIGYQ